MVRCSHDDCHWRSIAPSATAAWGRYAEHLVEEHATAVDVDIPEGMVQVKLEGDGEWITTTPEHAHALHELVHDA